MNDALNEDVLSNAISQYTYWLEATSCPRVAAGIANKQLGLKLSTREYKSLLKDESPNEKQVKVDV
jgi:hypothetical protein